MTVAKSMATLKTINMGYLRYVRNFTCVDRIEKVKREREKVFLTTINPAKINQ